MRTKEEILQNQKHGFNSGQKEAALKAMQQYADEFACAFAEWKDKYEMEYNFRAQYTHNIKELLEIFKKEINGL